MRLEIEDEVGEKISSVSSMYPPLLEQRRLAATIFRYPLSLAHFLSEPDCGVSYQF